MADMTNAMFAGNPAFAKVWADLMTENARFLSERLEENFETQKAMLACKTPAEVVEVQTKFFTRAMSDYSDKAQRMFEIMTAASEDLMEETKATIKRGYDDVPL